MWICRRRGQMMPVRGAPAGQCGGGGGAAGEDRPGMAASVVERRGWRRADGLERTSSPPSALHSASKNAALSWLISNFVSWSKIRMAPMSRLVTPPSRQISGTSHLGSAFFSRPIFRLNQTVGAEPGSAPAGGTSRGQRALHGTHAARAGARLPRADARWRRAAGAPAEERRPRVPRARAGGSGAGAPAPPQRPPRCAPSSSVRARAGSSALGSSLAAGPAAAAAPSRARISSAEGAAAQEALTPAAASKCSARRCRLAGTTSTQVPLRPARPVRPLRCSRVAGSIGRSAWITRPRSGRSRPRAATSVATHTRACPSRTRLQRPCALGLGQLAGQRDRGEAALQQAAVQVAHRLAGRAEHQRGRRLEIAEHVDHGVLGLVRRHPHGRDTRCRRAAGCAPACRCAARCAGTCAPARRSRGRWWRRTAASGAPPDVASSNWSSSSRKPRSSISSASSSTTARSCGQVERAAPQVVAQPSGRADHDVAAGSQGARASRRPSMPPMQEAMRAPVWAVEPGELARDLHARVRGSAR